MNSSAPYFSINRPFNEALPWLKQRLSRASLRVMQTFDFNSARLDPKDCPCPHHGTDKCDCQMIVLLVYGTASEPVTLILHGNDGQTWLSLIDHPGQRADAKIVTAIQQTLETQASAGI